MRAVLNAEKDILLEESEIDAIMAGNTESYPAEAVQIVKRQAQEFVNDLFSTLRERQIELRSSKVVFVGGGLPSNLTRMTLPMQRLLNF